MRITWFLMLGVLISIVLSILLIDDGRLPIPQGGIQPGHTDPQANPLAPPPSQP